MGQPDVGTYTRVLIMEDLAVGHHPELVENGDIATRADAFGRRRLRAHILFEQCAFQIRQGVRLILAPLDLPIRMQGVLGDQAGVVSLSAPMRTGNTPFAGGIKCQWRQSSEAVTCHGCGQEVGGMSMAIFRVDHDGRLVRAGPHHDGRNRRRRDRCRGTSTETTTAR